MGSKSKRCRDAPGVPCVREVIAESRLREAIAGTGTEAIGPAPRRNNGDGPEAPKAGGTAPEVPSAGEDWRSIAARWYTLLAESDRSMFYRASDWAMPVYHDEATGRSSQHDSLAGVPTSDSSECELVIHARRPAACEGWDSRDIASSRESQMVPEGRRCGALDDSFPPGRGSCR